MAETGLRARGRPRLRMFEGARWRGGQALTVVLLVALAMPLAAVSTRTAPTCSLTAAGQLPRASAFTERLLTSPAAKKGVSAWDFAGVRTALKESGATWFLTWSTTHEGIAAPPGVHFVPMVPKASSVTPSALAEAERSGPDLLTFNEPDMRSQADMTVAQALSLWPKLMATKMQLASPAVATDAATPGGWLDRFMKEARQRHYRVSFITVHWYGSDFRTADAVAELQSYLEAVHHRYGLPVWLTEFALIAFTPGGGEVFPPEGLQAAFVTASVRMLDSLTFVQRYAWFALPAPSSGPSSGLYAPGPRATSAGRAFAKTP